jgi:crotonobetainyl-CoA:carnitine CoA-transferase CaiB-like acyl-CoA transferase
MSKALPKKEYEKNAKGPLAGVRVIDLSRLVAGNTVTQLLGDFGAEIIKVEPPAGDTLRAWKTKGIAANWKLYSRNKKSLCLELRNTEARDIVLKLVQSASVFIESFRPGMLETIGLGPETLFKINPKLIIVRTVSYTHLTLPTKLL